MSAPTSLLAAIRAAQDRRDDEATQHVNAALAAGGSHVAVVHLAARLLLTMGRHAEAAECVERLRQWSGPDRRAALAAAAPLLERLGQVLAARAALEEALALEEKGSQRLALAMLFRKRDCPERALHHLRVLVEREPDAPARVLVEAAGIAAELELLDFARGCLARAARALRSGALGADDSVTLLECARVYVAVGDFERAEEHLRALIAGSERRGEAAAWLGKLAAWRGDGDGALSWAREAAAAGAIAEARAVEACGHLVRSSYADAERAAREAVSLDPACSEAWTVLAEAALVDGRIEDSFAAGDRAMGIARGFSFAPLLLRHLGELDKTRSWSASGHTLEEIEVPLRAVLGSEFGRLQSSDWRGAREILWKALRSLSGNRDVLTTQLEAAPGAVLKRVRPLSGPRFESRRTLQRIMVEPVEDVLREFDQVIARYPRSPTPLCHRGELRLWNGEYEAAIRDFEAALQRSTARWAYIGRGAAELLCGDPEKALRTFDDGVRAMHGTTGPSLFIYRGEARFRAGQLEGAVADLTECTAGNPRRVSAWVLLALAQYRRGDRGAAERALSEVRTRAPMLLSDALREVGAPSASFMSDGELAAGVLEHVLRMFRGNRASSCITYFMRDGQMRAVPLGERGGAEARALELRGLEDAVRSRAAPPRVPRPGFIPGTLDVELIAFRRGLKPAVRLQLAHDEVRGAVERYQAHGGCCVVEEAPDARVYLYVARSREAAEKLQQTERLFLIGEPVAVTDAARSEAVREMGLGLGYPPCCVEAFVEIARQNGRRELSEDYVAARDRWAPAPDARLNHLLFAARLNLVSFTPCSYQCRAALSLADALLAAFEAEARGARDALLSSLATTVVVAPDHARAIVVRGSDGRIERATAPTRTGADPSTASARDNALAAACRGAVIRDDGTVLIAGYGEHPPVALDFQRPR